MSAKRFARRANLPRSILHAVLLACLAAVPVLIASPAGAQDASPAARDEVRSYDIPAGPLDRVLNAFAGRADCAGRGRAVLCGARAHFRGGLPA